MCMTPCLRLMLLMILMLMTPSVTHAAPVPAFPGAEGFGAVATGGRGREVVYVTNLNDDGPGSLREALSADNRNILFKVSGTISLKSTLKSAASNITIAGQTAPGDGVCIRGRDVLLSGSNIIVRFIRFRPGDELGQEHDALTLWNAQDVIIDHCSMSWSTDSVNDVVKKSSGITVQWSIIAEPLRQSVHVKGSHGYGTGWGGAAGATYHHNLIAHCDSRSPRLDSRDAGPIDVRNNVIYNMGFGWAYGGEEAQFNYINNYYRPGPSTERRDAIFRISSANARGHFVGNVVEGSAVSEANIKGVIIDKPIDPSQVLVDAPFDVPAVRTQRAEDAFELVLRHVGATLPRRDAVDQRVIASVKDRTGHIIDSQKDVGGWPALQSAPAPADSDGDGLPDAWEKAHHLDPQDPADAQAVAEDGYTHLEHYLNELAAPAMVK